VWPLTDSLALVLFNREKVRLFSPCRARWRFPSADDAVAAVCAVCSCGVCVRVCGYADC
jgi:hypothetical protein